MEAFSETELDKDVIVTYSKAFSEEHKEIRRVRELGLQMKEYNELIGDVSLARLHEIFKSVMKRQEDKIDPIRSQFGKIEKDEINIEDKQNYIEEYMKNNKYFSFFTILFSNP